MRQSITDVKHKLLIKLDYYGLIRTITDDYGLLRKIKKSLGEFKKQKNKVGSPAFGLSRREKKEKRKRTDRRSRAYQMTAAKRGGIRQKKKGGI